MGVIEHVNLYLDQFTREELKQLAEDFKKQAEASIRGEASSLSMFKSHIRKQDLTPKDKTVLALDLGGSSIRAGLYDFDRENNWIRIKPGTEIRSTVYEGKETDMTTYTEFLANFLKGYLRQFPQDEAASIGITFSYPAKVNKHGNKIDVSREGFSDDWGKGFIVHRSGLNISEYFRRNFTRYGIYIKDWVSLNDVVALHLADASAHVSVVVGTGFNIGVMDQQGNIYNSEAAFFKNDFIVNKLSKPADMYLTDLKLKLESFKITESESSDLKKFSEIQISGGYLYRLLLNSLAVVGERNMLLFNEFKKLKSEIVSLLVSKRYDLLEQKTGVKLSPFQRKTFTDISQYLIERSTDLVASELAGAIMFTGLDNEVTIAADGSVIKLVPHFVELVKNKISRILEDVAIEIKINDDSGLKGAAVAAFLKLGA